MRSLVIVTGYDQPGRKDATGAFLPEAQAFRKLHGEPETVDGHTIYRTGWLEYVAPLTSAKRRGLAETSIRAAELDVLAVFGHGTPKGLIATGHGLGHAQALSTAIHASGAQTVLLYACSTALGREGFADVLAGWLPNVNVWAHTSAGHSTWNPNTELAGGIDNGYPIAQPGDPLWKRWRDRMHDEQTFRLSFWLPAHGLPREQAVEAVRAGI